LAAYIYAVNTPARTKWQERARAEAERRMFTAMKTFVPGYFAWRDFKALMSGEKPLEEYFFYKKWGKEEKPSAIFKPYKPTVYKPKVFK